MTAASGTANIYWQIDFRCSDPDEQGWQLIEHGAEGVQLLPDGMVRAYFPGDEAAADEFKARAVSDEFILVACARLENRNWLASCREIYEPLTVGGLRIVPIEDGSVQTVGADPWRDIAIIPGQGFGTGHHPSTQQVLTLLQADDLNSARPLRVLDFGTGSGILAIACCKLFRSRVVAVDVDAAALLNARENARRNDCEHEIEFLIAQPESLGTGFDLIAANVYAEVLIESEPALRSALRIGGRLLAAGILKDLVEQFVAAYSLNWRELERAEKGEWTAFALQLESR